MYTRFCSSVLFPLHELIKGHRSVALLGELERTQWLGARELESLQLARLRSFLTGARRSIPYYRELFARVSFDPEQVSSIQDLIRLPFLTKELIRENIELLKSSDFGRLLRYNTSGSSGEPLIFYLSEDRVSHDVAAKWRATRWWGVDVGDREIVLWGSPVELGAQDRLRSLRDRVLRSRLLPAFDMSDERMGEYIQVIRKTKPRMMFGYASAMQRLAAHARASGIRLNDGAVRVVFVTGETLYPDQRQVIEEVFGAPVANGYGARDSGFIAHQCPAGSLHVCAEHIVVELIGQDGAPVSRGEVGEVVVTHLATRGFPFIRYRTGDMAVLGSQSCACGRGLPVLDQVLGRSTDFIRTRSGKVMHALALIYEVRDEPGVRAFKFLQREDLSIELQIATGAEFTSEAEQKIVARLLRRVGADTPVTVSRLGHIPPDRSGKHRYVVSLAVPSGTATKWARP